MTYVLIGSWLFLGIVGIFSVFFVQYYPILSLGLLLPFFTLLVWYWYVWKQWQGISSSEQIIVVWLQIVWLLHGIGLFMPEVAFDALWYHLPVIQQIVAHHQIVFIPQYYQSLNPLFTDLLFGLGFMVQPAIGSKLVAYMLSLTLFYLVYQIARLKLNRTWSLLLVLHIALFQVITWQASSFYVDTAKAVWEIAALWLTIQLWQPKFSIIALLQKSILLSLAVGASLATKQFSVALLPFFLIWITWSKVKINIAKVKLSMLLICLSLSLAVPFYLFSFTHTGNPIYSVQIHLAKLQQIGGQTTVFSYFWQKLIHFWFSPIQLLLSRDYVSPLVIGFLPWLYFQRQKIWQDSTMRWLTIFGSYQWLLWWFIPPLSTRYALSGFIVILLVEFWAVSDWLQSRFYSKKYFLSVIIGMAIILCIPRILVSYNSLRFLLSSQTQEEYLYSKLDGWIDPHLKAWYGLK